MKIGVVSDTHAFFDPHLTELLAGVDAILHAGDVGSQEVLDELGRIAKVHAVRGNIDPAKLKLPPSLTKTVTQARKGVLAPLVILLKSEVSQN